MYWLRDAFDTLDTVLTYGDVDDSVFSSIVAKYRDIARDLGRIEDLERVVREVVELKARRHAGSCPEAG